MSDKDSIMGAFDQHTFHDGMMVGRNVFGVVALVSIIGAGALVPVVLSSVLFWVAVAVVSVGSGLVVARWSMRRQNHAQAKSHGGFEQ